MVPILTQFITVARWPLSPWQSNQPSRSLVGLPSKLKILGLKQLISHQRIRIEKNILRNRFKVHSQLSLTSQYCRSSQYPLFHRPGMRSGSSVILSALAVADTLTLLIGPTGMYINKVYNIHMEQQYLVICKTNRYLRSVLSYVANWLIIILPYLEL